MSVTLPIQALATMQVSLKIGSDGQFAVEMDPAGNANIPRAQLDGLKLHLQSVPDSAGIKLTLFVSVDVEAGSRHHPTVSVESCMEHHTRPALEFSAGAQLFDSFSELYSLESPYPNTLPDGPQAGEGSNSGSFESTQSFDAFQFYDILSQALDIDHPEPCHSNITSDGFDLALQPYDCDFQAGMLTELPACSFTRYKYFALGVRYRSLQTALLHVLTKSVHPGFTASFTSALSRTLVLPHVQDQVRFVQSRAEAQREAASVLPLLALHASVLASTRSSEARSVTTRPRAGVGVQAMFAMFLLANDFAKAQMQGKENG
ncbi:hypothetical protein DFH06DRAFT_1389228 [Mycena polygramma]|nr:hypothetical protein DFH06DRAFT_1389228 [Mycena polygramma]